LAWFYVTYLPVLTFADLPMVDLSLADLSSGSRVGSVAYDEMIPQNAGQCKTEPPSPASTRQKQGKYRPD